MTLHLQGMCTLDYSPDKKRPSAFWTHGKD